MIDTHPLENLITQYLEEKDIKKGSYDLYLIILKQYLIYLKENDITYAKESDVLDYINLKKLENYSTNWIFNQVNAIKGLYNYLSIHQKRLGLDDVYKYDITVSIQNEKRGSVKPKPILTLDQAKHLLTFLKEHRKYLWHYRDYAIVYLMLTTGIRSVEIRRARIKDLKVIGKNHILFIHGKGRSGADHFIKLSDGLVDAIKDYLEKRKDKNPYLFAPRGKGWVKPMDRTNFLYMFRRILKDAHLSDIKITPHALRHTAATFNLLRGGSLDETKVLLRHQDMDTTLMYLSHLDGIKEGTEDLIERYILGDIDD